MRNHGIEPKRLRAVTPSAGKKPSLILIEGKKDGKEGLIYENDLVIYKDKEHKAQTDEIAEIYSRF
jgi:tRNA1(Val) A37 N6-methylase TrmN6